MNNEERILEMLEQLAIGQHEMKQDVSSLKEHVTKMEITQENIIIPQLHLLAEGHTAIQNQIKRLSVIDAMQDDIATLKTAVKYLSGELEKIQEAM